MAKNKEQQSIKENSKKFNKWMDEWLADLEGDVYKNKSNNKKDRYINDKKKALSRRMNLYLPEQKALRNGCRVLNGNDMIKVGEYNREVLNVVRADKKRRKSVIKKYEKEFHIYKLQNDSNNDECKRRKRKYDKYIRRYCKIYGKNGHVFINKFHYISKAEERLYDFLLKNIVTVTQGNRIDGDLNLFQRQKLYQLFMDVMNEGGWIDLDDEQEVDYVKERIKTPTMFEIEKIIDDIECRMHDLVNFQEESYDFETEKTINRNKKIIKGLQKQLDIICQYWMEDENEVSGNLDSKKFERMIQRQIEDALVEKELLNKGQFDSAVCNLEDVLLKYAEKKSEQKELEIQVQQV